MKTKILALALVCILTSYIQAYSAEDKNPQKKVKLVKTEDLESYQFFISNKDNIIKRIGEENYENAKNLTLSKLDLSKSSFKEVGLVASLLLDFCISLKELILDNRINDEGMLILDSRINDEEMKPICSVMKYLTRLSLSGNNISEKGAYYLGDALLRNKTLTDLNLEMNPIGDEGIQHISKSLGNIRKLNLARCGITAKGVQFLSDGLEKSMGALTDLDLGENRIGDEGIQHISKSLGNIRKLNLAKNGITAKGVRFLSDGLEESMASLTDLDLGENRIGDEGMRFISKLLGNIRKLHLGCNGITAKGAQFLSCGLEKSMGALTDLDLGGNEIGDEGAPHIRKILEINKYLKRLDLIHIGIGDLGAEHLIEALSGHKTLKYLYLNLNLICDKGGQLIGRALKYLNLSKNLIGNKGAQHIGETLKINETLKDLCLDENKIGDEGMRFICEGLEINKRLTSLLLYYNLIGDKGAEHLSKALKTNKHLRKLDLCETEIGDEGMQYIREALKKNKTLIHLDQNLYAYVGRGDEDDGDIEDDAEDNVAGQIFMEIKFNQKMQLFWLPQYGEEGNYKKNLLSSQVYDDVVFTQRLDVESYYPA